MIIISDKINGNDPRIAQAIAERDEDFIANLAEQQTDAGADFILVNSGELEQEECREVTTWLMEVVEDTVDTRLYIENTDPWIHVDALEIAEEAGFFGFFGTGLRRPAVLIPLFAMKKDWSAVAYCKDDDGTMPEELKDKAKTARNLIERTIAVGAKYENLYIDPLFLEGSAEEIVAGYRYVMDTIRAMYPKVKFIAAETSRAFRARATQEEFAEFKAALEEAGVEAIIADACE